MPTTYTHYAYGQEVFHKLPEELQRKIEPYIAYYNIGVHGPDILFYYHSYCKNKVNQYGVKVHHEPAREFFKRAFKVFQAQKNRNEAFAYLAGFMTHFILDSSCHPYVRKRIKETGISHTEIETDWDFEVMQRDGRNLDRAGFSIQHDDFSRKSELFFRAQRIAHHGHQIQITPFRPKGAQCDGAVQIQADEPRPQLPLPSFGDAVQLPADFPRQFLKANQSR